MNTRYWLIRGHDGLKTIFEMQVGLGQFSENQIQHLLRALAARAGLNFAEIVGAYAKRRTKISNNLLAVHRDLKHPTYMCGSNPVFTASVVDEQGQIIIDPNG